METKQFTATIDSNFGILARFFGNDEGSNTVYTSVVFGNRRSLVDEIAADLGISSGEAACYALRNNIKLKDSFQQKWEWNYLIEPFTDAFLKNGLKHRKIDRNQIVAMQGWIKANLKESWIMVPFSLKTFSTTPWHRGHKNHTSSTFTLLNSSSCLSTTK